MVISMDCDFVKVLHPCKSVAYLGSWILNIYVYWKFGVGNIHINTTAMLSDRLTVLVDKFFRQRVGFSKPLSQLDVIRTCCVDCLTMNAF